MGKKLFIILLLIFGWADDAFSGSPHSGNTYNNTTNNYYSNAGAISGKTDKDALETSGSALSLAAGRCQHDWGSVSLQVCLALSRVELDDGKSNNGKAVGLGYWNGNILWSGVYAKEEGSEGVAAGMNFHF